MDGIQTNPFDYAAFDAETRIVMQQRTSEIKALMKRAASDIIEIGQKLIEVKLRLPHGQFSSWLKAEFSWSQDTATNFIRVAQRFGDNPKISEFAPSALYLLAAPSTPDSARQEALDRAAAGEVMTHQRARDIISKHRNPAIPFVADALSDNDRRQLTAHSLELEAHGEIPQDDADELLISDQTAIAAPLSTTPAVHQLLTSSESNEWYTPAPYVEAARAVMGTIDLDPASSELANRTVKANRYYTAAEDGLTQPWGSVQHPVRVWLNPPYGKEAGESNAARWTRRLLHAYEQGHVAEAVVLVNASTGDGWFAPLKQFPICFPDNRIRFSNADGEASQPTHSNALVYLGPHVAQFVRFFSPFGAVMARLSEASGRVYLDGLADESRLRLRRTRSDG